MFLAYYDRIIVRPTTATPEVEGELINPENDTKVGAGIVVDAGPRWTDGGPHPTLLRENDAVLYNVYAGIPHQDTIILRHTDILAVERKDDDAS